MSCGNGNRFVCGVRRMAKHTIFTPDKPSNAELHNENTKRLNELMRLREQQDKGVFEAPNVILDGSINSGASGTGIGSSFEVPQFTPWVAPSTSDYNSLKKID